MLPALPTGSATASGDPSSASQISRDGLLAVQPVGVDGVHHHRLPGRAQLADRLESGIEIAVGHDQPGPSRQRLGELAACDLARGQDDAAGHPRAAA